MKWLGGAVATAPEVSKTLEGRGRAWILQIWGLLLLAALPWGELLLGSACAFEGELEEALAGLEELLLGGGQART